MKVSIITVCFNSAETIKDTIESVLSQNYSDIEYIVIDGGSRDDTLYIIKQYEDRIASIISEPDKGIYDAMNKGIRACTGEIVGILNSDDFYESHDAISQVVNVFRVTPAADIVFGDVVFVMPENLKRIVRFYGAAHFKPWKLRFGWMPPHPATFIRKCAYDIAGEYSLDLRISADYEMFVRLLLVNKLSWTRIDAVLVRMRAGGISTSGLRSSVRLNREIVDACRRNGIYTNLLMVLSKMPFKLLELMRRPKGNTE
ncbi:glycosyltransferase family 2 protein [Pseudomonas sp. JZ134]|uniref:glycosyltransferase family 2 protein n=1 Tax=Pseudomonas sp. JZ134 TaxID=2806615 RepID=UPI003DA05332